MEAIWHDMSGDASLARFPHSQINDYVLMKKMEREAKSYWWACTRGLHDLSVLFSCSLGKVQGSTAKQSRIY